MHSKKLPAHTMNQDIEKARSMAGTTERASETEPPCKIAAASVSYCTTKDAGRQPEHIASLLLEGKENATPLRQLVALTGKNSRIIRMEIMAERLSGVPILSDNATGYYLPKNEQERVQFVRSMRHRAQEIERVAAAVEKNLKGRCASWNI